MRDRPALIFEAPDGQTSRMSFADVDRAAKGLATTLRGLRYRRGDRIGLHTGQHPATAVAHMAIAATGRVAVTLSQLHGPDTLAHPVQDSRSHALLTGDPAWADLRGERAALFPDLVHMVTRDPVAAEIDICAAMASDPAGFTPGFGGADDPALLMCTSGSNGKPKGILHGHRILAAYTPSTHPFFNLSMQDDDAVFWSPFDRA